ncbi:MAG: S46 family peptidase [Bryobacterales bacterium]|nr:S46 family peptidase [Bryobacterales bacterium]
MKFRPFVRNLALLAACLAAPFSTRSDEGMWLFNNPPVEAMKSRYGFEPSPAWLEHIQKSSVRFNNGGSGSLVSADGLVFTNHHVASDCLQKLSSAQRDYLKTGFSAGGRSEEPACPDLELNVLMSIEDVTGRVNAAVPAGAGGAEAERARRAIINTIEKESLDKTGLRSDVVTLYDGGRYHLYRYKKYTDVRLVFAPEKAIAFFGGDPDNFEYPRYDLDITFFRAYENGRPAKVEHFLKWNPQGAREGELIFVSGHPGRTDRLDTVNDLEFLRDVANPLSLNVIRRREVMARAFSERSMENARRAEDELFSYQNSRKARLGMLAGLQDPSIMNRKRTEENQLREAVRKSAELQGSYGDAWDRVAAANRVQKEIYGAHYLWERPQAFNTQLFEIARDLVRMAEETRKPNAERLREYSENALPSLQQALFSEAPVYDDLEAAKLADSLGMMVEMAGAGDPLVKQVLAGKSPQERAVELIQGTRLKDVSVRKKLAAGGQAAIEASDDPMIRLARLVDPAARKLRAAMEQKVEEPKRQAYAKLAAARFAIYGTKVYPDATFTLRLSFGQAKGYVEGGRRIPWTTRMGGAYQHAAEHQNREPFQLPESWTRNKDRLDLNTPFNFVSTADIIGGNSGSPVVNRAGEVVGIIFDGNIYSLVLDFAYTEERARAVSVHSAGITEALRKIYDARQVLSELGVGK